MPKPLKFHQTLNLQPRSAKHGQHRRPSPPVHGNSIIGADLGAGGPDQSGAITARPGTWVYPIFGAPEPPAIPHTGIRTGELIGHRLWWVIEQKGEQLLCSLAHRRLWEPGETVSGDVMKLVGDPMQQLFSSIWGGVYAFASNDSIEKEIGRQLACVALVKGSRERHPMFFFALFGWAGFYETSTFVSGTVKMWGEVVEHETGYRSQFAKLQSIDRMFGDGDLETLRAKYLPGEAATKGEPPCATD